MKRLFFYLIVLLWVLLLGTTDKFLDMGAWIFMFSGTLILSYCLSQFITEEELKEYSGYNLWCRILKINNEL